MPRLVQQTATVRGGDLLPCVPAGVGGDRGDLGDVWHEGRRCCGHPCSAAPRLGGGGRSWHMGSRSTRLGTETAPCIAT